MDPHMPPSFNESSGGDNSNSQNPMMPPSSSKANSSGSYNDPIANPPQFLRQSDRNQQQQQQQPNSSDAAPAPPSPVEVCSEFPAAASASRSDELRQNQQEALLRDRESDANTMLPYEGVESVDLPLSKQWKLKMNGGGRNTKSNNDNNINPTTMLSSPPAVATASPPDYSTHSNHPKINDPNFSVTRWVPGQPLELFCATWNMAQNDCNPDEVSSHFITPSAHIIAICTQENGPYVGSNAAHERWESAVTKMLPTYSRVESSTLWAVHLMIFARTDDVFPFISEVHSDAVKTGSMGNAMGNKGGVGIAFSVRLNNSVVEANAIAAALSSVSSSLSIPQPAAAQQRTSPSADDADIQNNGLPPRPPAAGANNNANNNGASASSNVAILSKKSTVITFLFIGAHLTAHQENFKRRNEDYLHIVHHMKLGVFGSFGDRFLKRVRRAAFSSGYDPSVTTLSKTAALKQQKIREQQQQSAFAASRTQTPSSTRNGDPAYIPPTSPAAGDYAFPSPSNYGGIAGGCGNGPMSPSSLAGTPYKPLGTRDVTDEFDVCCFFGDLNYRISGTPNAIRHIIRNNVQLRSVLAANDQLKKEMKNGIVFHGFEEMPLTFAPTYKLKKIKADKKSKTVKNEKPADGKTAINDNDGQQSSSDDDASSGDEGQQASDSKAKEEGDHNKKSTNGSKKDRKNGGAGGGSDSKKDKKKSFYDSEQYQDGPKARIPAYCDRVLLKANYRTMSSAAFHHQSTSSNSTNQYGPLSSAANTPLNMSAEANNGGGAGAPHASATMIGAGVNSATGAPHVDRQGAVKMYLYTDVRKLTTSDHRPVVLMASVDTYRAPIVANNGSSSSRRGSTSGGPLGVVYEEDNEAPSRMMGCL